MSRWRVVRPLLLAALATIGAALAHADDRVTVSGTIRGDRGEAVAGLDVWLDEITKPDCYCAEYADKTRSDGSFSILAPRGDYAIRVLPRSPYKGTFVHADARNGDVRGLAIITSVLLDSTFPDDPPRASRITTAVIDEKSVRVDGAAGSVAANSFVGCITLDTGHFARAAAGADGSFTFVTYGRPGCSLLIQSDRSGFSTRKATFVTEPNAPDSLASAPGTIVRVPSALSDPLAFDVTGMAGFSTPPVWRASGRINRRTFAAGDELVVTGQFNVDSEIPLPQTIGAQVSLSIERFTDASGNDMRGEAVLASTFLTPTALPIERARNGSSSDAVDHLSFTRISDRQASAAFSLTLHLPTLLTPGLFRPYLLIYFDDGILQPQPVNVHIFRIGNDVRARYLPLVRIGNPLPPRLTAMLLVDTPSGGTRGVRAIEDRNRFNLASRIVTQSDTIVVPRVDRMTGTTLRYRLEPYLPNVSLGDRGEPPELPRLALRLPSGSLTVVVHRPDGATDTLGPAPFVQSRSRTLVNYLGDPLDQGAGHLSAAYQLSTMDPRFEYAFPVEGAYTIEVNGSVDDEDGSTWNLHGTYEVHVGNELIVDTAVQPGTPFESGDSFDPAVTIFPAMKANVELTFRLAPGSDASQLSTKVVSGTTNRFGWFRPAASSIPIASPGEYRVDVKVTGFDPHGGYWAGFRTWGAVVAPRDSSITAHGRRAFEKASPPLLAWFNASEQTTSPLGATHVFFPFHSGDVMWGENQGAEFPIVTFHDPDGAVTPVLRERAFNYPDFDDRAVAGEAPLFISNEQNLEVHLEPSIIDIWGYSYRSITRPLVRVREMIAEDQISHSGVYWHFDAQYGRQFGVGKLGDLPNDFKFQYGGAVLRGSRLATPRYAIYGSLFVLIPDGAGERTFPPFQGNGGGPSGGPLFTLKGTPIDAFFTPTAIRPGSILEVGDTASFTGQCAPLLPATVTFNITSPSGRVRTFGARANRIGHLHDPAHELVIDEAGEWRVRVDQIYDRPTSAGPLQPPFPTGVILGANGNEYRFYAVERDAPALAIARPPWSFVRPADGPLTLTALAPDLTNAEMSYVVSSSGFILAEGRSSALTYTYDLRQLASDFPNLDLDDQDGHAGVDVVIISLSVSGKDANGVTRRYAQQVLLRGEELIVPPHAVRRRSARH